MDFNSFNEGDNIKMAKSLLGTHDSLPITLDAMAKSLTITFYPPHQATDRTKLFSQLLRQYFIELGACVISFDDAVDPISNKIKPHIVVIEQGEAEASDLAMYRLSSLYKNPLVAIYDKPCPVQVTDTPQRQLDEIVSVLTWNLTHTPIFLEEDTWTVCTMNGAIIPCGKMEDMKEAIRSTLIPKLAAQIIPPGEAGIIKQSGVFDPVAEGLEHFYNEFEEAAREWEDNGLMQAHTSLQLLQYRDKKNRRFIETYLDQRTGMSYGFMARQLPTPVQPATLLQGSVNNNHTDSLNGSPIHSIIVKLRDERWRVNLGAVQVLTTRSGCKKTQINPSKDIVRMRWEQGAIYFDAPIEAEERNCRPSYDTHTIMSHAVANTILASILETKYGNQRFADKLRTQGLSLSHWHGYLFDDQIPEGYLEHGKTNPPVSCSTPQSAIFSLLGKLMLNFSDETGSNYCGDVHTEPHHGTVVSGTLSLVDTAKWAGSFHRATLKSM